MYHEHCCISLQYFKTAKNIMEGPTFSQNIGHVIIRNVVITNSRKGIPASSSQPKISISYSSIVGLGFLDCEKCYKDKPETCSYLSGKNCQFYELKLKMPIHRINFNTQFRQGIYKVLIYYPPPLGKQELSMENVKKQQWTR